MYCFRDSVPCSRFRLLLRGIHMPFRDVRLRYLTAHHSGMFPVRTTAQLPKRNIRRFCLRCHRKNSACGSCLLFSEKLDPVHQCVFIKRLQNIIRSSQSECIGRDIFIIYRTHHNETHSTHWRITINKRRLHLIKPNVLICTAW